MTRQKEQEDQAERKKKKEKKEEKKKKKRGDKKGNQMTALRFQTVFGCGRLDLHYELIYDCVIKK